MHKAAVPLRQVRNFSFQLPAISTLDQVKAANSDYNGLFKNATVNQIWFERGQHLLDGLNQTMEDHGLDKAGTDLQTIIAGLISKPQLYGVYAYSAMLYNLQFFLESLKPNTVSSISAPTWNSLLQTPALNAYTNAPTDPVLLDWITQLFGSVNEFRTLLLNSARGIKGDGNVWLVAKLTVSGRAENTKYLYKELSVTNTYNAGVVDDGLRSGQVTKLKGQKQARLDNLRKRADELSQLEGTATQNNELQAEIAQLEEEVDHKVLGSVEEAEDITVFSNKKLVPLLSIDVSPRNYLLDYGVFGKDKYLDNLWESIDWDVVAKRMPPRSKQFVSIE